MGAFFESDLGRRVVTLEVSARRAMLDEAVDDAAKATMQSMMAKSDPRLALIRDFIEAGDLIEANVAGGLNANLGFYRGMVAGGAIAEATDEAAMLADVWGQEATIRHDTTEWLLSYLALAYQPLSDEDLVAYTAFSESPAGRSLNAALFAAFDAMFVDVSQELGHAAAVKMAGQDL
jgi:hypothetical protein